MLLPNMNYAELESSYLFYNISQRINAYLKQNPDAHLLRLGIGDVTRPLCPAVTDALHKAVSDQADASTFHGYMPECGAPFLREAIAKHYIRRGVALEADEIFVSSGASDELGDILDLFDKSNTALITEPAYPAYVDASVIAGRKIIKLAANKENGFLPMPHEDVVADIIYICSPANPTGAAYNREELGKWIDYANENGSVILFDAAYEAFVEDESLPRSIFELDGAKTCAIEICSLSKTAGFTGTRLGYTVIPKALVRNNMSLNSMWVRNRTTKTNGVSYIIQRGAEAVFTIEGEKQIKENIAFYKENAKILADALDKLGIYYTGGKNSPYLWLECPHGLKSWDMFDLLLDKAQIVGTPGVGFGEAGKGYFRFSSFASREDCELAAKRLCQLFG